MTKKPKLISSIRAKLVSAVAMLLVAVIMVVSSTYAWFTLSTAPEVTGISTQIGANGSLEMALVPTDGDLTKITSAAGDSLLDLLEKNLTWGNLVDLENAGYGWDKIVLAPSELNIVDGVIKASPVQIPVYGADGRVSDLDGTKTMTSVFDNTKQNFYAATDIAYGVRAIGAASGMTDLQLAYRDSRSQGATATAYAKTLASQVLNDNGSALANIAITHGMGGDTAVDANGKGPYDKADVVALRALIDGTDAALDEIEEAYKLYIAAYVTSRAAQTAQTAVPEAAALAVYELAIDTNKSLSDVTTFLTTKGVSLGTLAPNLQARIDKLNATRAQVVAADNALATPESELATDETATFLWSDIADAMTPLAKTDAMTINGFKASEVKSKLGDLVSSVTEKGGLFVTLSTGAGVFADIADHCGDYEASVTIDEVNYNGIKLNNMKAMMETDTTLETTYLSATASEAALAGAPAGTSAEALPFSEYYGYIIDMAFRTNAAESNLLLQTTAIDRIYGEENNNEATIGHGSTMTFSSPDPNFDIAKTKALMSNLRVVFFLPEDDTDQKTANLGEVLVYAKLDMDQATVDGREVTAPLVLYKPVDNVYSYTDGEGDKVLCYAKDIYYSDSACTTLDANVATATLEQVKNAYSYDNGANICYVKTSYYSDSACTTLDANAATANKTQVTEIWLTGDDAVITSLPQNVAVAVSAMVYLDGESMGNDDVSATVAKSLTGSMNLQFSSSANLVPMKDGNYYTPDKTPSADAGSSDAGSGN